MQNASYFQTAALCQACGGSVQAHGHEWRCSVCGIPCDHATGDTGVSRGNPTALEPRTITLNANQEKYWEQRQERADRLARQAEIAEAIAAARDGDEPDAEGGGDDEAPATGSKRSRGKRAGRKA